VGRGGGVGEGEAVGMEVSAIVIVVEMFNQRRRRDVEY